MEDVIYTIDDAANNIVHTIDEAMEKTGWSKEKLIKNHQNGIFKIELKLKKRRYPHESITYIFDHIKHEEYLRIIAISDLEKEKPTIEQLETTTAELRAENESLRTKLEKFTKNTQELRADTKEKINAFLKALKETHPNINAQEIAKKTEGYDTAVSFQTVYRYLREGV
jgi:hypothetical protein